MAFVHHTVSLNEYSKAEAPAVVRGIQRYHQSSNGWSDVGYNFLVDRFGQIYEGRAGGIDRAVIGAQAQGWNSVSTGIASVGTHTSTRSRRRRSTPSPRSSAGSSPSTACPPRARSR